MSFKDLTTQAADARKPAPEETKNTPDSDKPKAVPEGTEPKDS